MQTLCRRGKKNQTKINKKNLSKSALACAGEKKKSNLFLKVASADPVR
jgi:hypothetical protein